MLALISWKLQSLVNFEVSSASLLDIISPHGRLLCGNRGNDSMTNEKHQVTVTLTPAQLGALEELAKSEQCDLPALLSRGADTLLATYRVSSPQVESKLERMHDQTIKLLVSLMKLVGQAIYFSALPVTTGPVKAKLNQEGVAMQWHRSEKFAIDLLSPPASSESTTASAAK